tara:strand:+ start:158 stop:520 length:363 start_codon:yes stop_codon:yes gene_type:complete
MAKILSEKRKRRDFEAREVYKKKGLSKNLTSTGYEAYRVSPQTTTKFGKKYRKIYGATVEPDYSRKSKGKHKYGAKVSWHQHGFTSASVKSGTRTLANLKHYPVDFKEARRKLMMKKRRR